jgi:hypothetical protein
LKDKPTTEARRHREDREKQTLPLIHGKPGQVNTEDTDLNGGIGKILPHAVGEVYANQSQTSEVHANQG